MKKLRNVNGIINQLLMFFVIMSGILAFSLGITFGNYHGKEHGLSVDFVLQVHSHILIAVGAGLWCAGVYIRYAMGKIAELETKIEELKKPTP